jgi:small subunit ribosomal protein S12
MTTRRQLLKSKRKLQYKSQFSPGLLNQPHKKGVCMKIFTKSPRKPNSARRNVAKVRILTNYMLDIHIPGIGHNLKEYSIVLIRGRGGHPTDLPGMKYQLIRGKYDLEPVQTRVSSRSKYGKKKLQQF